MTDRHDIDLHDHDDDDALRARLRDLRQDRPPARDLWPAIAAAIAPPAAAPASAVAPAAPAAFAADHHRRHHRRPRARRLVAWSAAASVAFAVALGWSLQPGGPGAGGDPARLATATVAAPAPILVRQADAMGREFAGAAREIDASRSTAPADDALTAALAELDRSATEIRAALALAPDSRFLLDRLQSVYARRLALAWRSP